MYSQSDRNTSIENLFEIIKSFVLKIKRKSCKPCSYGWEKKLGYRQAK